MKLTPLAAYAIVAASVSEAQQPQFVLYSEGNQDIYERQDAIISPGTVSGHVHELFGASRISPDMTYASLQDSDCTTVGGGGAAGDPQVDADRSAYWHPALYASPKDGSDGYIRLPVMQHKLYYTDVRAKGSSQELKPFPEGFRMVAGDMAARGPYPDKTLAGDINNPMMDGISMWKCGDAITQGGSFPQNIGDCSLSAPVPQLMNKIHFRHCWNGNDYDPSDPNAHMAYPQSGGVMSADCPSSHNILLPHIQMEIMWDQKSVLDQIDTNSVVFAHGDPTGFGAHADFFNGWNSDVLMKLLTCFGPDGVSANQDVGQCSSFTPSQQKRTSCTLKGSEHESILDNKVAPMLPGCNPVTTRNPAPIRKVVPLGKSSLDCPVVDGSDSSGSGSTGGESSAPAYNPPSSAAAPQPSTMSTSYVETSAPAVTYEAVAKEVDAVTQPNIGNGVHNHAQAHRNRYGPHMVTNIITEIQTRTAFV